MLYPLGVWFYMYRDSGWQLTLPIRQTIQRLLRPHPQDATPTTYRARCLAAIQTQLQIPALTFTLHHLEHDEWTDRWEHAAWHPASPVHPFATDEQGQPLYAIPARCPRCGHEFLGRDAICAPTIMNCACFWCHAPQLRRLPRYPTPRPEQTMLAL